MLNEGKLEEGVSDTIISLIPKSKDACKVEDFIPFLCATLQVNLLLRC